MRVFDQLLDQKGAEFPWDEKEDLAFWRGSTTSGNYSKPAWRDYPRSRLVFISRDYPKVLDAKFSNLILGAQYNEALQAEEGIFGEFLLPDELIKYKYLIDVDGNASTYSRYYWILRSNCVPIKQVSCFTQWNYAALEPYKHYVPVKEDLSDLKDQTLWAKTHPEEARSIAEESRRMVQEELSTEDAYVYLYLPALLRR